MKKLFWMLVVLFATLAFSTSLDLLNVKTPNGVVGQPYYVRVSLMPATTEGTFDIALEGHFELAGINLSMGTYSQYPGFPLDNEVYLGLGIRFGGFFASVTATTTSLSSISDISSYAQPKVAFGLLGMQKTNILFYSWSRFELSYIPNDLIVKEGGQFKINENFDWTNAQVNLVIESQDVGYFLFGFYSGKLSEIMNGNFKYAFELAIPADMIYVYAAQNFDGNWKTGIGLALNFANAIALYDFGNSKFIWKASVQF
jgi:hypothetical protein